MSVLFTEGKGVLMRRTPYVVHTKVGTAAPLVRELLAKGDRKYLFDQGSIKSLKVSLLKALRSVEGDLELRSCRRGALECMAKEGVSLETLMTFSGHKRTETLLRYLRWGLVAKQMATEARKAANSLW